MFMPTKQTQGQRIYSQCAAKMLRKALKGDKIRLCLFTIETCPVTQSVPPNDIASR